MVTVLLLMLHISYSEHHRRVWEKYQGQGNKELVFF
jgi:hypothetical protein